MASGIGRRRAAAKEDGAQAYQDRRREIAEAAARVFNRKGFQGATMAAVADEMNIDRASLYYYISNKEELFDEVIRKTSLENVATAQQIQRSTATPPEKLKELIVQLMRSYGKHYPLLYIYIRENLKHVAGPRSKWAQQMRQLNRDYDDAVTAIIDEGYADGSFQDIGPARIVAFGMCASPHSHAEVISAHQFGELDVPRPANLALADRHPALREAGVHPQSRSRPVHRCPDPRLSHRDCSGPHPLRRGM